MPQETNLNSSPYFDDFDKNKNYHKVLFKPGFPVQSRELTSLQTILQNQIEQFGTHFFKEGAKVIPGNLTFIPEYPCVQIESFFLGIPVSSYLDNLIGLRIRGEVSGVTAVIINKLTEDESERGRVTLYLKYENSSPTNFSQTRFLDGENLITDSDIVYGLSVIPAGESFAKAISSGSSATGSAVSIGEGVYFIRGYFVQNTNETLILDQYGTTPSYRIGWNVLEEIITADEDETLYDNAQGYNNYSAPGADRFKISVSLSKKILTDTDDRNFIEISRINNGIVQSFSDNTQYNIFAEELARRTYDESGDYYTKPFDVFIKDCLNNQTGNNGIYSENQITQQGNVPTDDLFSIQISPGKAYVKGFEVDKISTSILDARKPRTTKKAPFEVVAYDAGGVIEVDNVFGSPVIGIGTTATVALLSERMTTYGYHSTGTEIGQARVYDFKPQSVSFVDQSTLHDLRLFDIDLYDKIIVGTAITSVSESDYIEGYTSGASGFVASSGNDVTELSLRSVTGQFQKNERIVINGIPDSRTIIKVISYGFDDVKSIRSAVGVSTFSCDLSLNEYTLLSTETNSTFFISGITATNTGIITSTANNFIGIVSTGNIISYSKPGFNTETYNVVTGVSTDGTVINIAGITTVTGVCDGGVIDGSITSNDLVILDTIFNPADNSYVTSLNYANVSEVDITNSTISVRKQYTDISFTDYSITTPSAGTNLFFKPFDPERYFLSYNDGTIEPLTQDNFILSADSKTVTFVGLTSESGKANLIATLEKTPVIEKKKLVRGATTITVTRSSNPSSGIGTTTLNDGLTYSKIYGTRVQDDKISLRVPEVIGLAGVFESNDSNDADLPSVSLTNFNGTTDVAIGEKIKGETSNSVALVAEIQNSSTIGIVYLNENRFQPDENVSFTLTGTTATIVGTTSGDKNITDKYNLVINQKDTYYDFSYIKLKQPYQPPSNRLKIVFTNLGVDANDSGDLYTANSYPQSIRGVLPYYEPYMSRLTDIIDIRPRVAEYSLSSTKSPFDISSRSFASNGQSVSNPLASEETLALNYSYYLPRIDAVYLDSGGSFVYSLGEPSDNPQLPKEIPGAIKVATISLPAYLYDIREASVTKTSHKRFTMADIGKIENRVKNIEYYTQLSLLETDTSNLNILDSNGLSRFKSGFFVDNFRNHSSHDIAHPDFKVSIDSKNSLARPTHYTNSIDLVLGSESVIGLGGNSDPTVDINFVNDIDGTNVRKTGRILTLNYAETEWITQPFASRIENVTPYLIVSFTGALSLNPPSDVWVDTKRVSSQIIDQTQAYDELISSLGADAQTGLTEVDWGSWETVWTSEVVGPDAGTKDVYTTSTKPMPIPRGNTTWRRGRSSWVVQKQRTPGIYYSRGGQGRRSIPYVEFPLQKPEVRRVLEQQFPGKTSISAAQYNNFATKYNRNAAKIRRRGGYSYTESTYGTVTTDIVTTTQLSREGIQSKVTYTEEQQSIGDSIISKDIIPYMRSRNIDFYSSRLKPITRMYSFFDSIDVSKYTTPKLLEIEMVLGSFEIGERVIGIVASDDVNTESQISFAFRCAVPNHKTGPYNNPDIVYSTSPYDNGLVIPSNYSTTSTILNIDTFSLSQKVQGEYFGYAQVGMILRGETSGAQATVTNLRLIVDSTGYVAGSFFVPDPNVPSNPRWESGTKTFKLTSSSTNSLLPGENFSSSEERFFAQGELETVQETILNIRIPSVETITFQDQLEILDVQTIEEAVLLADELGENAVIPAEDLLQQVQTVVDVQQSTESDVLLDTKVVNVPRNRTLASRRAATREWRNDVKNCRRDPLAQSFFVEDKNGAYATSIDVFFQSKDEVLPVYLQIRPMSNGLPTSIVLPLSEVELLPSNVQVSDDASVATRFTFESPIYLEPSTEYAVVLLSDSQEYNVWISRMGEVDISTASLPEAQQILISQQPSLGSLFKSQNGSTWDPSQFEDLKFTLYKAQFATVPGTVRFYNPDLSEGNGQIIKLPSNSLETLSRVAVVGLGTTVSGDLNLIPGVTISQLGNLSATAKLRSLAGVTSIGNVTDNGSFTIVNPGVGYTPFTGVYVYTNVPLRSLTGMGRNLIGNVTVSNGGISSVSVSSGGDRFVAGDLVGVGTLGLGNGAGAEISVGIVTAVNTLLLDGIQGNFTVGVGTVTYFNPSTSTTVQLGVGATIKTIDYDETNDGLHFKVLHRAHGMNSTNNIVKISNVKSDIATTKLVSDYSNTSTASISVLSATNFTTFEGLTVSGSNPGYIKIGNEIIRYTGVTLASNTITGITRGIDGTKAYGYSAGSEVEKYEAAGVSLRRINRSHDRNNPISTVNDVITDSDHYYIKLNMADTSVGINRSNSLYFTSTKSIGGERTSVTQNMQFETLTPLIGYQALTGTSLTGSVRTVTATSIGGSETSYIDQGYQQINLVGQNNFDTPRLIASKVNETAKLSDLPGNKSFTLQLTLNTNDRNISPVIDLDRVSVITTTNRINNPISDFSDEQRIKITGADPCSATYVTKLIALDNPATSLSVIFAANRPPGSDIRVLYKVLRVGSSTNSIEQKYELFPGYTNLLDGNPRTYVPENINDEYSDYNFGVDGLQQFTHFQIKVIMVSTNQAKPPKIKDFRAIALA